MILKQGMKVLLKPKEWYNEKKGAGFLPSLTDDMKQYFEREQIIKSAKMGTSQLSGVELFTIESDPKSWYFSMDMVDKYYDVPVATSGSYSVSLAMQRSLLREQMRGTTDFNGALGFSNSLSIHVGGFIKYVEKFVPFAYDGVVTYTDDENNSFTLTQLYERFSTNS